MPKLQLKQDKIKRFPITLEEEEFFISIVRPTFEQAMTNVEAWGTDTNYVAERLKRITGWEGLTYDDGENMDIPYPFCETNMKLLCEQYPQVLIQFVNAVSDVYRGIDAPLSKVSGKTPPDPSKDAKPPSASRPNTSDTVKPES